MSDRLRKEILAEINDAWLNINVNNEDLIRPLDSLSTEDPDLFYKQLTWFLTNPEYFAFLCKHIFKIDVLPFQSLILQELYTRKFPMLIGSRGMGKAGKLSDPVLTSSGWVKMGDINLDHKVYGRDGLTHNITGIYPQGKKQVCRLKFADGRTIDCCEDHLWVMKKQQKEVTVSTKDIINAGVRYDSPSGKWAYKYKLPLTEPIQYEAKELPLDPYILGCLLGDGCMTTKTPKIASDDMFIIDQFKTRLEGFELVKDITNNSYTIVDRNKDFTLVSTSNRSDYFSRNRNRNRLTCIIESLNLNVGCKDKFIPEEYKNSSVEQRMEIVRGLLDADGCCSKDGAIEFTNTCKQLVDDLIDVLRSLGISCQCKIDDRSGTCSKINEKEVPRNPYYRVFINTSKKVFKLPRKVERLKSKQTSREKYTALISAEYVDEYEEMQCISVDSTDHTYITKDYIVTHNTFIMSLYCLLRAFLMPNRKIVVVGAAFRQSKFLHDYMENIWKNSGVLRDLCDSNSGPRRDVDMCKMIINGSQIVALPIGDGSKIRGQRANDIISDEFASMSREIFENVIAGFAAVSASPAEQVKIEAAKLKARELNVDIEKIDQVAEDPGNQIVIAGTAYYDFNHFATYWKRWKNIVKSKGDPQKLKSVFGEEPVPDSFDWKDYSIIRVPVDLIPRGFMDEAQIARSKATIHNGIYLMEFGACFCTDSAGFFKRTLIESCVASDLKPVKLGSGIDIHFDPLLKGNPAGQYIIGVDPASEVDNFSIVVLEVHPDHRRIVHSWTTSRQQHKDRVKKGLTEENDFYSYCARKIRDLMGAFPTIHLAMDAQGGGIAVSEALHDPKNLSRGEVPIWPIIDEDKAKDTDDESGLHILEMCQFARATWLSEANHGLRKDFEDKVLLLPRFDPITIGLSIEQDKMANRTYDTLEDCVMEIEELKNELAMIEIKVTAAGREHWDTPEVKVGTGKKERVRKDRYSSLLMANMAARTKRKINIQDGYNIVGGFAHPTKKQEYNENDFIGPAWITEGLNGVY